MISFAMTDEQESARAAMRGFADRRDAPAARASTTRRRSDPRRVLQPGLGARARRDAARRSVTAATAQPRSPVTNAIVLEELAYGDADARASPRRRRPFAYAIADQGTDEQRDALLPPLCGERYPRRGAGGDRAGAGLRRAARRAPPRRAQRQAASCSPARSASCRSADRASHFLVVARTAASARRVHRAARRRGPDASAEPEKNLGLKALPTAHARASTACASPSADRLGGAAGADVRRLLNHCRVGARRDAERRSRAPCSTTACPYAKERVAFGEAIARRSSRSRSASPRCTWRSSRCAG